MDPDLRVKYICITCSFHSRGKFGHTGVAIRLPQEHSFRLYQFCFMQLLSTISAFLSLLAVITIHPNKMQYYETILLTSTNYYTMLKFLLQSQMEHCNYLLRISEKEKIQISKSSCSYNFWSLLNNGTYIRLQCWFSSKFLSKVF